MTHPSRRLLLAAATLSVVPMTARAARPKPAALSPADQALVDRAVAYLDGLVQVKARFTQTDQKGRTATGDLYLKRPGKLRLAYDPPQELLVVSDGNRISVQNKRLQTFNQYALSISPLSLFLAKHVRLDRGVRVSKVESTADGFTIVAFDGARQTQGQISLTFANTPFQLKEWTVVDAGGGSTRVQLGDLVPVPSLDPSLFVLRDPRPPALKGPHG